MDGGSGGGVVESRAARKGNALNYEGSKQQVRIHPSQQSAMLAKFEWEKCLSPCQNILQGVPQLVPQL